MAYKYSKGAQVIGDLKAADDAERNTLIDFGEDQIEFQTSGSTRLKISGSNGQITFNEAFSFPTSDGSANQILKTDGNGSVTWQNESGGGGGSPGGPDGSVQINDSNSFTGSSGLLYDGNELYVNPMIRVVGEEIINDSGYSTGYQADRSFTLKRHYNFSGVAANTWHDIISWRPYLEGTTTDPGSNTFYGAVSFKLEISGHTNGVSGNGYRSRTGYVSYEGSSAATAGASDISLGTPVSTDVNRSGWVTKLRFNPDQLGATGFSGTVYVEIHFARGAGSNGEAIEWSIT